MHISDIHVYTIDLQNIMFYYETVEGVIRSIGVPYLQYYVKKSLNLSLTPGIFRKIYYKKTKSK